MFCRARTRSGGWCRRAPIRGKRRCYMHGGLSPGNRRPRGAPWLAAITAGRRRWLAHRHALGLKATGGRPRKARPGEAEAIMAKAVAVIDDELRALPAAEKQPEAMTPAELLSDAA